MEFKRSIGALGLLFAGIGSILGSGWLFGPLYAAQIAGPSAIISWILGACLMIFIALTFAELGSAFPVAGGIVQYAHKSYGALVSFITGWMVWISSVSVAPIESLAMIQYAANYIPSLVQKEDTTTVLTDKGILAAALVMLLMCALNYYGAKFFSRSNSIITSLKLIVPTATILLLFTISFHSSNFHAPANGGFAPFGWHGILAALPLGGVIYSFIGSNTILQLAAETKNPQRNIPMALISSIFFCMLLYVSLQIVFIGALSPSNLLDGWHKLQFVGDSGPFAGIISALGIGWFVIIIYADAVISPFGTGLIFTTSAARVSYSLSDIGFFPNFLHKLSKRGVPLRGMLVNYLAGLVLLLPFPAWQKMASFIISCFITSCIIGPVALIALRHTHPHHTRPFRLPCANFFGIIAFYICNLLIYWTGWHTVSKMMIAMLIGCVLFIFFSFRKSRKYFWHAWKYAWWVAPYFSGMAVISFYGSFGHGRNKLPFGDDFAAIGLLTLVIFYITIQLSKRKSISQH